MGAPWPAPPYPEVPCLGAGVTGRIVVCCTADVNASGLLKDSKNDVILKYDIIANVSEFIMLCKHKCAIGGALIPRHLSRTSLPPLAAIGPTTNFVLSV
jgi:hypothetical protein